jgi:hypothetical protein
VESSRDKADAVFVAAPEVLGDTYEDLVMNLDIIARHKLAVIIVLLRDGRGSCFG